MLEARCATLDVEINNIKSLITDLKQLRTKWDTILSEAKLVATQLGITPEFPSKRKVKQKRFHDETFQEEETEETNEETAFQHNLFNVLLDSVIYDLTMQHIKSMIYLAFYGSTKRCLMSC